MKMAKKNWDCATSPLEEGDLADFTMKVTELSPLEIEEMLEYMQDRNYLNKRGSEIRHKFWETFVKE